MKTAITSVAVFAVLALALPALAEEVDARQDRQQQRIQQGLDSGALTEKEAARLQRGQERIERIQKRVAADGEVTGKEVERLKHAQDVQSRKIAREKHDRQKDVDHDGQKDRPAQRRNNR
ncbi:MAG: hypothetical protein HQL82_04735 [Magnetococcales bacterium]|nr:hypothetical protein [Magnetococcales bacterium]